MQHLGTLLDTIPLPLDEGTPDPTTLASVEGQPPSSTDLLKELAADLPAGHLHVWGGPSGAGKTSFLLNLLHGAAQRARPVVYATFDLPAPSLAMRLLAMLADVDVQRLPDPGAAPAAGPDQGGPAGRDLTCDEVARLRSVRAALRSLPFYLLPARGFSVASLADRLVRAPVRPQVLLVDYVQAVIRERDTDVGSALRALSDLAVQQHVAVVGVFRSDVANSASAAPGDAAETPASAMPGVTDAGRGSVAARVGWIAPADDPDAGTTGARTAEVLQNRYGQTASMPLHIDPQSGRVDGVGDTA